MGSVVPILEHVLITPMGDISALEARVGILGFE